MPSGCTYAIRCLGCLARVINPRHEVEWTALRSRIRYSSTRAHTKTSANWLGRAHLPRRLWPRRRRTKARRPSELCGPWCRLFVREGVEGGFQYGALLDLSEAANVLLHKLSRWLIFHCVRPPARNRNWIGSCGIACSRPTSSFLVRDAKLIASFRMLTCHTYDIIAIISSQGRFCSACKGVRGTVAGVGEVHADSESTFWCLQLATKQPML